jgi:predicted Zn finger-like uncharacterized protein
MALIADLCPNCQRIPRCHVVERVSVTGGLIFGIPFVLPASSTSCSCGECGFEFRSQTWNHEKAVSPAEAVSLNIEALLSLTNPALKETLALAELKAVPRLSKALHLLQQLTPGRLRTGLKDTLGQWTRLKEGQQERFLAQVHDCAEAFQFARSMAGRYTIGLVGCLAGILACVGVWSGCLLVLGTNLNLWAWVAVFGAGIVAGALPSRLLWSRRDRRWVREVLLPEADRAGIRFGWLLAVLEDASALRRVEDELRPLRELAPAIRAELASSGKAGDETDVSFGALQQTVTCPKCQTEMKVATDQGRLSVRCTKCRHAWDWCPGD